MPNKSTRSGSFGSWIIRTSTLSLVTVFLLILMAGGLMPSSQPAAAQSDQGRIAYVYDRDIYVMNVDGSGQTNLTNDYSNEDEHPAWSPDGTRIAFASNRDATRPSFRDVYVMNADGSNITRLTNSETSYGPVWSPDGTRIAFNDDGLVVMQADGSGAIRLGTNEPSGDPCCFSYQTWSIDGEHILFTDTHWSTGYFSDIYIMNADGSGITRLTNAEQRVTDTDRLWIPRNLAISPDGTQIVADIEVSELDAVFATKDLFVMNLDGSGLTNLSNNSAGTVHADPTWSPDGTQIAFVCNPNQEWKLCTMNADGTGVAILADGGYAPHWWGPASSAPAPAEPDPAPVEPSENALFFEETGLYVDGRIREYWEANGGLPVFGLPITPQQTEMIEGQQVALQWFERNRLELHPENESPYDVLLGRLGADRLEQQGYDWQSAPQEEPQADCRYFEETGRNVCEPILSAWRADGLELDGQPGFTEAENLALFGLPLTSLGTETLSDGNDYQVQYFERARFELHPENEPPFNVLLGLLGSEVNTGGN